MNEATLPPSPNWYLANILACAKDGTVVWGARNSIVVATPGSETSIHRYSMIVDAHLERVTSLACSPKFSEAGQRRLVSGGDEHIVRIWDLDSMSAVMAYSYADSHQKVVGVDWSKANPDLVCCVSTDGSLVVWNVARNNAQLISLGKFTATCLSCCPHDPDLVAIGTKSGLVYIVKIHNGNGKIVYKLRGHDAEISSLSWCPIDTNITSSTNSRDLLLASGGKEKSIFIWRAGGDGRYETELTLPNSPMDSQQHKSKLGKAMGGWTAVRWVAPNLLLTSSSWGELISWDLSTSSKSRVTCKLIHACHARGLFCIANVESETEAVVDNWRSENSRRAIVWTLAQDRRVVCCNISAAKTEITYNVPTQGGYTYCLAASPLDTSRVAFGVGDAMLRLWNLCEPHENTFDITLLWQKIKGKVMAISWHPEKENLLAFGTGEGRVGVFDTNTSKPPILYRQYHKRAVYTLGWGPNPNCKNANYALYSCGDGELVYYDHEKPNQEPKSVIKKDCTEFSWKPDGSCLAVGFENGLVSFLNRDLQKCGTPIHTLKKAVQCFAWHPESTSTDLDLSPLRHHLAVSTNAHSVVIFDLHELAQGEASVTDAVTTNGGISVKIAATLNGHGAKIVSLAWSPHISGYLASASYDSTVQVWKTETEELIGTYTGHCGPVHCCMWSPMNPDLIITGSADFTVRIWRLSDQIPIENTAKPKKVRTKKNKHQIAATTFDKNRENKVDTPEDETANSTTIEYATNEQEERAALAMDQARKKKSKKSTYFPVMAKETNSKESILNSIMDLVTSSNGTSAEKSNPNPVMGHVDDAETIGSPSNESPNLSIFGSKDDILKLLDTEKSAHAGLSHYDTVTEMDLWCNNLKQNLQEAVKEKRLNDFLVSLSPNLSVRVWQEMCEAYAAQLEFEGNHRKAVAYLLGIHKIDRAIQVFVNGKMFKEAYVLAKCKLDETDPMLNNLLETWAIATAKEGNFEVAVQCYIKLGNYGEAAQMLSKRKDWRSLEVAAQLALKSGDEEFGATLAEQAVTQALLKGDYESAESFIETFPQIQHCQVKVAAVREIDRISCDDKKICQWFQGNSEGSVLVNLTTRYPDCGRWYPKLLKQSEILGLSKDKKTLLVEVADHIVLAVASVANENKLRHLVAAAGVLYRYETTQCVQEKESDRGCDDFERNLLVKLMSQLDEKRPQSDDSMFADKEPSIRKSLRAYLCYGFLSWLTACDVTQVNKESRQELFAYLMKYVIQDALDKQTVRYNVMSAEVNKLESALAAALAKSHPVSDSGSDGLEDLKLEKLSARLAEIRTDKEKYSTERLHAPNPVLVYSKACELIEILYQDEAKEQMLQLLTNIWTKATS